MANLIASSSLAASNPSCCGVCFCQSKRSGKYVLPADCAAMDAPSANVATASAMNLRVMGRDSNATQTPVAQTLKVCATGDWGSESRTPNPESRLEAVPNRDLALLTGLRAQDLAE